MGSHHPTLHNVQLVETVRRIKYISYKKQTKKALT